MVTDCVEKKPTREDLVEMTLALAERAATGDELTGIDAICGFVGQSAVQLLGWRRDFSFPMQRGADESMWCASRSTIRGWFISRGLSPETATEGALHRFWEEERRRRRGIKRFNRLLIGVNEIAAFAKTNSLAIQEWQTLREGCPIEKTKNGTIHADADQLVWWCGDQGLRNEFDANAGRPLTEKNGGTG